MRRSSTTVTASQNPVRIKGECHVVVIICKYGVGWFNSEQNGSEKVGCISAPQFGYVVVSGGGKKGWHSIAI